MSLRRGLPEKVRSYDIPKGRRFRQVKRIYMEKKTLQRMRIREQHPRSLRGSKSLSFCVENANFETNFQARKPVQTVKRREHRHQQQTVRGKSNKTQCEAPSAQLASMRGGDGNAPFFSHSSSGACKRRGLMPWSDCANHLNVTSNSSPWQLAIPKPNGKDNIATVTFWSSSHNLYKAKWSPGAVHSII